MAGGKMECPVCRSALQEIPQTAENDWRCARCGGRVEGVGRLRKALGPVEAEGLWRRARGAGGTGKPCPACRNPMAVGSVVVNKEPALLELCAGCSFVWMSLGVHQKLFGALEGAAAHSPASRSVLEPADLAGLRWDEGSAPSRARSYFRYLAGSSVVMNVAYPVLFGFGGWRGAPAASPDLQRAQLAVALLFNAGMLAVLILFARNRIFESEDDATGHWYRGRWMEAVPKGVHQALGWLTIHFIFLYWLGAFLSAVARKGH